MKASIIAPNWVIPANIRCVTSSRKLVTQPQTPYSNFNLATHVGDAQANVLRNRNLLRETCELPAEPLWLNQTHSTRVVAHDFKQQNTDADASFTIEEKSVCVVMTADCLPVLFTTTKGDWVAASHAGWRGLVDGILLETLKTYQADGQILAWIGPAISQKHFEVGPEVKQQFSQNDSANEQYFKQSEQAHGKWLCDLAGIAEQQLSSQGVIVTQSNLCTFENKESFYSYRRDGVTGRMASLIWIDDYLGACQ